MSDKERLKLLGEIIEAQSKQLASYAKEIIEIAEDLPEEPPEDVTETAPGGPPLLTREGEWAITTGGQITLDGEILTDTKDVMRLEKLAGDVVVQTIGPQPPKYPDGAQWSHTPDDTKFWREFNSAPTVPPTVPPPPGPPPVSGIPFPNLKHYLIDGQHFVRVEERNFLSEFTPDKTYTNVQKVGNNDGRGITVYPEDGRVLVNGADLQQFKYLIMADESHESLFYDVIARNLYKGKYGAAVHVKPGPLLGPLMIQNMYANGYLEPIGTNGQTYSTINKDFFTGDGGGEGAPVYMRCVTARKFADGGLDAKDRVYVMNATISDVYRLLRLWRDVEIILVDCILRDSHAEQIWFDRDTPIVKHYRTLWDGEGEPNPAKIGFNKDNVSSKSKVLARIEKLYENPLKDIPFFRSDIDGGEVQIRKAGAPNADWSPLHMTGPFIGDPLYAVPEGFELRSRFYRDGRFGDYAHITV